MTTPPGFKRRTLVKAAPDAMLTPLVVEQLHRRGIAADANAHLEQAIALFKDRCSTTAEIADWLAMYFAPVAPSGADLETHLTPLVRPAIETLRVALAGADWTRDAIQQCVKDTLAAHQLKMPQLAMAVRVLVCGRSQTPSLDAVLALFAKDVVLARLRVV